MRPWVVVGFGAAMEEKLAFGLEDVPREVWGGLAGGVLGGLAGHGFSSPETKKRNAILGALAGAGVGATGARLLGRPDSAPAVSNKQLEVPGPETARPSRPEPGKLTAQAVEPVLQQSEARTQQAVQQQAVQQALQLSSARERAAIVRDQGQVAARMQALLAPRAASPAGAAPPSPPPSSILRRRPPQHSHRPGREGALLPRALSGGGALRHPRRPDGQDQDQDGGARGRRGADA